jgi:hypothetical protein
LEAVTQYSRKENLAPVPAEKKTPSAGTSTEASQDRMAKRKTGISMAPMLQQKSPTFPKFTSKTSSWNKIKLAVRLTAAFQTKTDWGATHSLSLTENMQDDVLRLNKKKKEIYTQYIPHDSSKRGVWDLLGMILVVFEVFYMPYHWAFAESSHEPASVKFLTFFVG